MKNNIVDLEHNSFTDFGDGTTRIFVDNVATEERFVNFSEHLENGGGINMNVNGSVTPIDFKLAPPAGERWFLELIGIYLQDPGVTSQDNFGSINALPDPGLEWFVRINSTDHRIVRVRDNAEVASEFPADAIVPGQNRFLEGGDLFRGSFQFLRAPTILDGDNGDMVFARVNDNLTAILRLLSRVHYFKRVS